MTNDSVVAVSAASTVADAVSNAVSGTPVSQTIGADLSAIAVVAAAAVPLQAVVDLLKLAGETQKSVYDSLKRAAALCAPSMSANLTPAKKVAQVMAIYAGVLADINDSNVTSTFSGCLWPHADGSTLVKIPGPAAADGTKTEIIVPAAQAVNVSKTVSSGVAKQLRDANDAGRATGAGRPKNVVVPPVVAAPGTTAVSPTAPLGPKVEATFFDELEVRLGNPGDLAKIVAAIERKGYKVTRPAAVSPALATTTPDATAALANALAETAPAGVLAQAAAKAVEAAKAKAAKK